MLQQLKSASDNPLTIAASLETGSTHPIAEAISEAHSKVSKELMSFDKVENIGGMGLQGYLDGQEYAVGNQALMESKDIIISDTIQELTEVLKNGTTVVFVSKGKALIGWIEMKDELRDTTNLAISKAKNLGLEVIMLTGDRVETASTISKEVGITRFEADSKPDEKAAFVKKITERRGNSSNDW